MQRGRRGFFSTAAKLATAGGAAVLLPREAMAELNKSGMLREAAEEIFIDESYELGPEEVQRLLARIKQLEHAIANPTWFQGRHGRDGYNGATGMTGCKGDPGTGLSACEIECMIAESMSRTHAYSNCDGSTNLVMPDGTTIPIGSGGPQKQIDVQSDWLGEKHQITVDPNSYTHVFVVPDISRVQKLEDTVKHLVERAYGS